MKRSCCYKMIAGLMIALTGLTGTARAASRQILTLPSGTRVIEAEAFADTPALSEIDLPDGVREIQSRAFANSGAQWIYLPESLSAIADDAFEGCDALRGWGKAGIYAESWCAAHAVPYNAVSGDAAGTTQAYGLTWTEGLRIDDAGADVPDADWKVTDYASLSGAGTLVTAVSGEADDPGRAAFYSRQEPDAFLGAFALGGEIAVPEGAAFFRLSCPLSVTATASRAVSRPKRDDAPEAYAWEGGLAAGESMDSGLSIAPKIGLRVAASCAFDAFDQLTLQFDSFSPNAITVDGENVTVQSRFLETAAYPHGLTLSEDLTLRVTSDEANSCRIVLETAGGAESAALDCPFNLTCYETIRLVNGASPLKTAALTVDCAAAAHPVWVFGDSFISTDTPARWSYYAIQDGCDRNTMFCGATGATSAEAQRWLSSMLTLGRPRVIVWCMGMNDRPDGASAPGWDWQSGVLAAKRVCQRYGAELVLATIPTTPTKDNERKNDCVRSSGCRYIDFAEAVGAQGDGAWYEGMLSDDGTHPTVSGALALYRAALAAVPELAQ